MFLTPRSQQPAGQVDGSDTEVDTVIPSPRELESAEFWRGRRSAPTPYHSPIEMPLPTSQVDQEESPPEMPSPTSIVDQACSLSVHNSAPPESPTEMPISSSATEMPET